MKAVPMKGRLVGKRISACIWAGRGRAWTKKENYFQLESDALVSAAFGTGVGYFVVTCTGTSCEIVLKRPKGKIISRCSVTMPGGRTAR